MTGTLDGGPWRTAPHLLLGAAVGVVLSPLVGGGLAGFLDGPDLVRGLAVGAAVGLATGVWAVVEVSAVGGTPLGLSPLGEMIGAWLVGVYVVLGSLGGVVGAYAVTRHRSRS